MYSRPSRLQLLSVLCICSACTASKKQEDCWLPGPCEGPPGVILVSFSNGTTASQIDTINASVGGKVVVPGSETEDLYVPPQSECEAIAQLRSNSHVVAASPELYVFLTQPSGVDASADGSCPSSNPIPEGDGDCGAPGDEKSCPTR
jgi:hypothetical protein